MKRTTGGWLTRRSVAPWDDTEPIRAEVFGRERFEQHAVSLADSHMVVDRTLKVVSIVERLDDNASALLQDYRTLLTELGKRRAITPAAEWLVDNFHIVERNVRQVGLDLPPSYFKQLPKLGSGFLAGHPRIFGIVWAYVAHTDSLFDPEMLAHYVRSYEARKALSLGELWAAAITLRLLLLENLRRLADRIVRAAADRERADEFADQLLGLGGKPARPLHELTDQIDRSLNSRAFAVQLIRRLRDQPDAVPSQWISDRLSTHGLDPEHIVDDEHHSQSTATVTIRNIFTSLRLIGDVDWSEWLESVSLVEAELRSYPAYVAQDFPSRNLYRSAIEELARGAGRPEIDVARAALHQAREAHDAVTRDPGFWLIDDGRTAFAVGDRLPADVAPAQHRARSSRRAARLPRPGIARPRVDTRHHIGRDQLAGRRIVTDGARRHGGARCAPVQRSVPCHRQPAPHAHVPRVRPAGVGLAHRRAGRAPDTGRDPDVPRLPHQCRRARGAARGPLPGECVRRDLLRPRHRLARQPDRARRRRRRTVGPCTGRDRATQRAARGFLLVAPPSPPVQPGGGSVDGLGAQARQVGRAEPLAARRRDDELHHRRGAHPPRRQVRAHARQRHPAPARSGPPPHRQARSSAEPAGMGAGW